MKYMLLKNLNEKQAQKKMNNYLFQIIAIIHLLFLQLSFIIQNAIAII